MSFTIMCDKCGNKLTLENAAHYISEKIDLLPEEIRDYEGYLESRTLSIFCNNKKCNNEIEVHC